MMWIFWIFWIVTACALHLFGNNAGTFVVLVTALVLPGFSWLWLLRRFRARLELPGFCLKGSEAEGSISIRTADFITCRLVCENSYSGEQTVVVLSGKERVGFRIQPLFGGEVIVRAEGIRVRGPLGLFKKGLSTVEGRILISDGAGKAEVSPEGIPDVIADNDEYSMTYSGRDTSEIYGVRTYVPGDSIKSIHWKLTEKLDRVMVREFGRPLASRSDLRQEASLFSPGMPEEGVCLCKPMGEQAGLGFLPGVMVFAAMMGALVSMLELGAVDLGAPPSLGDCFRVFANRIFTLSEGYQAYRYEMFEVPPYDESWVIVPVVIISLLAAAWAFAGARLRGLMLVMFSLFAGVQIYFGIFPGGLWNILAHASMVFTVVRGLNKRLPGILVIWLVVVSGLAFAAYPGKDSVLAGVSESIRDRFDEKVERPISVMLDSQGLLKERSAQMRPETGEEAGEYGIQRERDFAGSQIGSAPGKRLWVLWLAPLAVAVLWVLVKYIRRRRAFTSADYAAAIDQMFIYLVRCIGILGLEPGKAYGEYAEALERLGYARGYAEAVALWQEAVYSDHEMTREDRMRMRGFLDRALEFVYREGKLLARVRVLFF